MSNKKFIMSNLLYSYLQNYTDLDSETFGNAYKSAVKAGYSKSYARVITVYYKRGKLKGFKEVAEQMKGIIEAMKNKTAIEKGNKEFLHDKKNKLAKGVIKRMDELFK